MENEINSYEGIFTPEETGAVFAIAKIFASYPEFKSVCDEHDLMQEVYYKWARIENQFKPDGAASRKTYLCSVARNLFIDMQRKLSNQSDGDVVSIDSENEEPMQVQDKTSNNKGTTLDFCLDVESIYEGLPIREKQIFTLKKAGLSTEEISEMTGIPVRTINLIMAQTKSKIEKKGYQISKPKKNKKTKK